MSARNRSNTHRRRLAYEAARIMVDQGLSEFDRARRKAATRSGIDDRRLWPSNEEIQAALLQHRRLFQGERQELVLQRLRRQALEAMELLRDFEPRLVGALLAGIADGSAGVRLHLFSDNPEDLVHRLLDQGIPWRDGEEIFRYGGGVRRAHPVFRFFAGEIPFELVLLPLAARRNPPLDPVSERPQRGAGAAEVARLLGQVPPQEPRPGASQGRHG